MERNLALFFDGTWNARESGADAARNTNVLRMYLAVRPVHAGREQLAQYIEGVGTSGYDHIRGGAFGHGLDRDIRSGYRWLVENYRPGDRVYVFGFSRGAYTARSLVGMIRNAGLLLKIDRDTRAGRIPQPLAALSAHERDAALDDMVERAYELYRSREDAAHPKGALAERFRGAYSREIEIECLGIWDTVGALGIPLTAFQELNDDRYPFHDTKLTRIVRNAFHAVALDEHREPYRATLWDPADPAEGQRIEQAWFPGAHADVGGGYGDDRRLADLALCWMHRCAREVGLGMEPVELGAPADAVAVQARIHDSYRDFLGGAGATLHGERHYRAVGNAADGPQTLDPSVLTRVHGGADAEGRPYAPRNAGFQELFAAYRRAERAAA